MDFPLFPLLFNLALLGVILFICRTLNVSQRKPVWNGALLFFALCFLAMTLDFVLTMVFASASFHDRTQYESIASRSAWSERVSSYLIPCVIALWLGMRFRRRQRVEIERATGAGESSVTVQTSPYTQSELRL